MGQRLSVALLSAAMVLGGGAAWHFTSAPAQAQDKASKTAVGYEIDAMHSAVAFKISHVGINQIFGIFPEVSGSFSLDKFNHANSKFDFTVKAASVTTGVGKRDDHLRSPDFFSVKEFPTITFKSTKVEGKAGANDLTVTGDLTLRGVTKPITVTLLNMGDAEFPKGTHRTGLIGEFKIKRSDYGMTNSIPAAGDEVLLAIGFEGVRK